MFEQIYNGVVGICLELTLHRFRLNTSCHADRYRSLPPSSDHCWNPIATYEDVDNS